MTSSRIVKAGLLSGVLCTSAFLSSGLLAADYNIDVRGMHASVLFKVSHMGFSTIAGRFNQFDGSFSWDKDNPSAAKVEVTIQMASLDTNHAARDDHLRTGDYLNVEANPTAHFMSKRYEGNATGGRLVGDLTMNGVTKEIALAVTAIGEGNDPWGGYRAGFDATVMLTSADFGWTSGSFPKTVTVEMHIEGTRK